MIDSSVPTAGADQPSDEDDEVGSKDEEFRSSAKRVRRGHEEEPAPAPPEPTMKKGSEASKGDADETDDAAGAVRREEMTGMAALRREEAEAEAEAGGQEREEADGADEDEEDEEEEDEEEEEEEEEEAKGKGMPRRRGRGRPRKKADAASEAGGRSRCVDERGNLLPRCLFYSGSHYYVQLKWRRANFIVPLQCGVDGAGRERDRVIIACLGPAEAASRLEHPLEEYAGERFYRELFASAEPPRVGVHDPEPGTLPGRWRLVEYLRAVGALQEAPAVAPKEEREEARAAPAGAPGEGSEGEGAEEWRAGPLPQWAISPEGVDHLDLEWGGAPFRAALGRGTEAQAFMQWRDRALLALHGPADALQHDLSFEPLEYEREPFYRALFGPAHTPAVGLRDPHPGTRPARRRLRAFLRSLGALPPLPRPPGTAPAAPASPPAPRRGPAARVRVRVRRTGGAADALSRARDRLAIALFGAAAATRPGLCFPLWEYAGEGFYRELFGEQGPAAAVGVHDPVPGTQAAAKRLLDWLLARCDCFALAPSEARRAALQQGQPPEADEEAAENVPLEECELLPPHVYCVPCKPPRFFIRTNWGTSNLSMGLRHGVRLFAARRTRDALFIAALGPEEASRRGLCYRLEDYEQQPFYRALFGPGERAAVGVQDPAQESPEGRQRVRAFLARFGFAVNVSAAACSRRPPAGPAPAPARARGEQRRGGEEVEEGEDQGGPRRVCGGDAGRGRLGGRGGGAPYGAAAQYGMAPVMCHPAMAQQAMMYACFGGAAFSHPAAAWAQQQQQAQAQEGQLQGAAGWAGETASLLNVRRLPQSGETRTRGMRFGGDVGALLLDASRHFGVHLVELWDKDFNRVTTVAEVLAAARISPIFYAVDAQGR
eukprot:tig00021795_g23535.t1